MTMSAVAGFRVTQWLAKCYCNVSNVSKLIYKLTYHICASGLFVSVEHLTTLYTSCLSLLAGH